MWRPCPWPIGMGRDFIGYDLLHDRLEIMDRADRNKVAESVQISGLDDPRSWPNTFPPTCWRSCARNWRWRANCCPPLIARSFLEGHMTPIWFGSAINSFGVRN